MKKKISILILSIFMFTNLFITSVYSLEQKKAIIVLPGIMGSNLQNQNGDVLWVTDEWVLGTKQLYYFANGTLKCTSDGVSTNIIKPITGENEYGALDTYKQLVTDLKNEFANEYDVIFASYDWRLDNTYSAQKLKTLVDNYDKVSFVAHSMGGLVASKYLQLYGSNKVEKVITLGTPYWGSLDAADTLHTGEVSALPTVVRFLMSGIMRSNVLNYPSIHQLLPSTLYTNKSNWLITEEHRYDDWYDYIWPDIYEKLNNTQETEQFMKNDFNSALVARAKDFHNSLYSAKSPILNVDHTIIVGSGLDTIKSLKLVTTLGINLSVPQYSKSGDGTVPLISATMGGGIDYISRPGITHGGLVTDPDTISLVIQSLKAISTLQRAGKNTLTTSQAAIELMSEPAIDLTTSQAAIELMDEPAIEEKPLYRFTFGGDADFEALKDNNVLYHVYKKTEDSNTYYDFADGDNFKINTIANIGEDKIFLTTFSEDDYTFKLKSNKTQTIDLALGPDNKRYAFNNIELSDKSLVYVNADFSQKVDVSVDYDSDGIIDDVINPNIKYFTDEGSQEASPKDFAVYTKDLKADQQYDNTLFPDIKVKNTSNNAIKVSDINLEYFFTRDGNEQSVFECDWAGLNNNAISNIVKGDFINNDTDNTTLNISFADDNAVLNPGEELEIKFRIHDQQWNQYNKYNDYSFNGDENTETNKTVLYFRNDKIFGIEPIYPNINP